MRNRRLLIPASLALALVGACQDAPSSSDLQQPQQPAKQPSALASAQTTNAPACAALGEAACDASSDCHSVYVDPQMCACVPAGCCTVFEHCAEGAKADCSGRNLRCRRLPPHCEGPYVVSYVDFCYEGCVRIDECSEPPIVCRPGPPHTFPQFDRTCGIVDDCDIGFHQIDCCGSRAAIGINSGERDNFDGAEANCEAQYPPCGCAPRPTSAEDGQQTRDESRISVRCANGECRTFVLP